MEEKQLLKQPEHAEVDICWLLESITEIQYSKPICYKYLRLSIKQIVGADCPNKWAEAIKALPDNKIEKFVNSVQRALEL